MAVATDKFAEFQTWIGRTQNAHDEITAFPVNALAALLDANQKSASLGTEVPPLWHWLYFLPLYRPRDIRHDGHAYGGEFMPPLPLPRRVWAGSKFEWNLDNPLKIGDQATRTSRIASITPKVGSTGELVFVKIIHEFHNESGLCFSNEHNSAFRGNPPAGLKPAMPVLAETTAAWHRELVPDPVLLFRYSAITFNAHRIHYDAPYAIEEEGYPALLVHGPLIATLLMDLLRRNAPDVAVLSLEFKAIRPSFVGNAMHLRGNRDGDRIELWASDNEGRLTMKASATVR